MSAGSGIALDGVRAGYGETVVLEGVSLRLPARGTLAVLGRNGVGKTTLLATIMGHTTLHGGGIRLGATELGTLAPHRRARLGIGWVPQEREVFRSLTVEENLAVAERPGRWTLARVYDLFPSLAARRRHYGNELSGGEQQMLSIGRALMTHPDLVILDEATEGLAPLIVAEIWRVIGDIRASGIATLIVDRDYRKVLARCDRAIVLQKGQAVLQGAADEVVASPQLAGYLGV